MHRSVFWSLCVSLVGFVLLCPSIPALGKEKAEAKPAETKKKAEKKQAGAKKASLRLPAHYGDVITEEQRDKIAAAYAKYNAKLAKLKEEIKSMTAERDKALEDMLTAEQKSKLSKLREDAKSKRKTAAK